MARPTKAKAIERLQKALEAIPELEQEFLLGSSPTFASWHQSTLMDIARIFGHPSVQVAKFNPGISWDTSPPSASHTDIALAFNAKLKDIYLINLRLAKSALKSMIEEIEEDWEEEQQTPPSPATREKERKNTNEVFVIHGRDNEAKETVARFLEKLTLTPVILHEQPNEGRTIIEKFEQHAQVGFAVALLTPDDVGALRDSSNDLKPRARQNVVFELGYFLGRLGRKRVCALTKGNIEIPSDYDGVVYISLDDGGWKMDLIRELKNVGFEVDANKAL